MRLFCPCFVPDGDVHVCIDSIPEQKRKHSQPDMLVCCLGVQTLDLRNGSLRSLEFKNEFVSDFAGVWNQPYIWGRFRLLAVGTPK